MYFQNLLIVIFGKILAIIIGLLYLRRLSLPYRLILIHTLLAVATETGGKYVAVELHQFNIWVFNLYWIAELWLLGIAGVMLSPNYRVKRMIPWLLIGNSILWLSCLYRQGICTNPTTPQCISCIILVILYFSLLIDTMLRTANVLRAPEFWLSISTILFFSCAIPIQGLYNYLIENGPGTLEKLYKIIGVMNQVRYPLVGLALYLYGSQQAKALKVRTHVL